MDIGNRYGRWTVIAEDGQPHPGRGDTLCRCECGNTRRVYAHKLRAGQSTSCGCVRRNAAKGVPWSTTLAPDSDIDITVGATIGRWTVTGEPKPGKNRTVPCRCSCGNERDVVIGHLTSGRTRSCGCLRAEGAQERAQRTVALVS